MQCIDPTYCYRCWSVCLYVFLCVGHTGELCKKTAELIEMRFGRLAERMSKEPWVPREGAMRPFCQITLDTFSSSHSISVVNI